MSNTLDISVLELLASKLCHDLISPIGAINNGIEILEEMGAEGGDEITELIAFSAGIASAKLQVYRMAYGAGGADSSLKPEDVHKAIAAMIDPDGKIKQDWDPHGALGYEERPGAFCKILICTMLQAIECIPKGGTLIVRAGNAPGTTEIEVQGENAAPREKMEEALSMAITQDALTPKFIHPYISGLLAQRYGFKISVGGVGPGFVILTIDLPSA